MYKTILWSAGLLLIKQVIVPMLEEKINMDLNGDGKIGKKQVEDVEPVN